MVVSKILHVLYFSVFAFGISQLTNFSFSWWCVGVLMAGMETEERNQRACKQPSEPELFLQWGNRKRVRCVRVKDPEISARFNAGIRRKITSRFASSDKDASHLQLNPLTRSANFLNPLLSSMDAEETRENSQILRSLL